MKWKCQICGKKVNNNNSYGCYSFLVCSNCRDRLLEIEPKNPMKVMTFIFKCGLIRNEIAEKEK